MNQNTLFRYCVACTVVYRVVCSFKNVAEFSYGFKKGSNIILFFKMTEVKFKIAYSVFDLSLKSRFYIFACFIISGDCVLFNRSI